MSNSSRPQNPPYGSNQLLRRLHRIHAVKSRSGNNEGFQRARKSLKQLRGNFERYYPGQFTYQRTLGYGGFGLATLWKVKTQRGRILDVAVKSSLGSNSRHNDDELRNEINIQGEILKGAEHIVQLEDVEENLLDDYKLYNNFDADVPVMIMEVLEKSTLSELIDRINKGRLENRRILRDARRAGVEADRSELQLGYIPNRILWRLFLCLVRGIVGMAYGPPPFGPNYQTGDKYRETIQDRPPKHLLHMDLDIYNVLLGDIRFNQHDDEHSFSPTIKIADFGIAIELHPYLPAAQKAQLVRKGKRNFFAPEQRDLVRSSIDPEAIGMPINVWAVGLVMLNLLTLAQPENHSWNARVRTYPAPTHRDPNYRLRFVTWGWFLIDDEEHHPSPFISAFDPELRLLIARCLETYDSDAKHNALAEAKIAPEEGEYRQRLIAEEQRLAEAEAASFSSRSGASAQRGVSDTYSATPIKPGLVTADEWVMQLGTGTNLTIRPKRQTNDRPTRRFATPGKIDLQNVPLISLPSTDPWETVKKVPMPPGYDPTHPVNLNWPLEPPTPGFQGIPSPVFEPLQPQPPRNSATRHISRNEYRPLTEFQAAPELEDADLITKFYDDHIRNPPRKVDPYEKLWLADSQQQQQSSEQDNNLRMFGPSRRGTMVRVSSRSRSPRQVPVAPIRQRSSHQRSGAPSPPSRRRFAPRDRSRSGPEYVG
ncbi:kinase-like domain-containing protein [Daldinia caldariorum]|uniref:kinase-like domain-containing protein n=1 Tax=Daldinia caldariorum TaxID=326644 RepID=UPI002007F58C|nr:kinase-like domain-containing protein [Daldinia caldariorum]KAI1465424.1 kinase-like domain-containing protein [Daldinia caldariorum]